MDQTQLVTPLPEPEGNIGDIVRRALRVGVKGRWWILLTALTVVVLAVIVLAFVPNVYRSEATILIVEQQIPQSVVASLSTDSIAQKVQSMTWEVLSRDRLLQIIDETGLFSKQSNLSPDAAVALMRKSIEITPIDAGRDNSFGAFSIAFSADTPDVAQQVTRKLSSSFIEKHAETQVNQAVATGNFLKQQLTEKRKRSAELERQIRDFKTQFAGELPEEHIANAGRLADLRAQLQSTVSGLNRSRQQRFVLESTLKGNLGARLSRLKDERAALLTRLTPKHPDVAKKDQEIAQVEALLALIQAGAVPTEKQFGAFASGDPMITQLETVRLEIEDLVKDQTRLEAAIAESQRHLNLTPARAQQLAGMERESDALNQEIIGLEKMDAQSGLSADMVKRQEGQQFQQHDPPSFPSMPSSPPRLKMSLAALGGGIALGLLVAFLLEMRNPSFHTEQELRQHFAPPMVLSVPLLPTSVEKRNGRWKSGFEWLAGATVAAAMLAIEFYVYKHP